MVRTEGTIRNGDAVLFVRTWRPATTPRAILAICHGFNAHSGYYEWVGEQCAANGLATYAVDLRGRGKSSGVRFYVEDFAEYVSDLSSLVNHARAQEGQVPVFVLGHSAGGVVGCLYMLDHGSEIAGFICEDFAFEVPAPDFALAILKGLSHIAPRARSLVLKNEHFTRDPAILAMMNSDPLIQGEAQPLATAAAIVRADERIKRGFSSVGTPLLIIHGTEDKAARQSGSEHFYEQAGSADKMLKLYRGYFHDPLNDLGKEAVMEDILDWIGERAPPVA
jgi:alpha-beta hydrolase superfamily lysophospholipase